MLDRCRLSTYLAQVLYIDLMNKGREVAIYLIDHAPEERPFITSDAVLGVGWDDAQPDAPRIRWLGEAFSPSGHGSHDLVPGPGSDREQGFVHLANRLAARAIALEKTTGKKAVIYPQTHIHTREEAGELWRYMGKHLPLPAALAPLAAL